MANHKSALKRIRQTEKRRLRNRAVRSQMRTVLKKFYQAVDGELEGADLGEMHRSTVSTIARAAPKGYCTNVPPIARSPALPPISTRLSRRAHSTHYHPTRQGEV